MSQTSVATGDSHAWIEICARMGYAAKGIVYAIIGVLAVQVALGTGGETSGAKGALASIADEPFGKIILGILAVGLLGYAVWRFIQAGVDPERKGTDFQGIAKRIGYVCSGIVYVFLAFEAGRLLMGAVRGGEESGAQHWTAQLMQQPFGPVLVGAVGAAIIGTGIYQLYRAYTADFQKMLKSEEMSSTELKWSQRLGRFGFAARGVVYLIIGGFLIAAALNADPSRAAGVGEALRYLAQQAYGPWFLGIVAAGLAAYGVFSAVILSQYRRITMRS